MSSKAGCSFSAAHALKIPATKVSSGNFGKASEWCRIRFPPAKSRANHRFRVEGYSKPLKQRGLLSRQADIRRGTGASRIAFLPASKVAAGRSDQAMNPGSRRSAIPRASSRSESDSIRVHIPSDLLGITSGTYEANRDDRDWNSPVGPFSNEVRTQIRKLGLAPEAVHQTLRELAVKFECCDWIDDLKLRVRQKQGCPIGFAG